MIIADIMLIALSWVRLYKGNQVRRYTFSYVLLRDGNDILILVLAKILNGHHRNTSLHVGLLHV